MSVVDSSFRKSRQTLGSPVRRRPDGPSLYFDFMSGRVDPRLTFSRASTATCVDKNNVRQTAAIDQPRFEYDALGNLLGLLMEEVRTNYLLNSGAPATQTVTLSVGIYCVWSIGGAFTVTAGTAVVVGLGASPGVGYANAVFSVTTGGTVQVVPSGSPSAWQLENGSYPTSYIPTAGSAVTRAQDILSIGFLANQTWYNSSSWSAAVEVMIPQIAWDSGATSRRLFGVTDGTNSNRVMIYVPTNETKLRAIDVVGGVSATHAGESTDITPGLPVRAAIALNGSTFRASLAGGAVLSAANGIPSPMYYVGIGYVNGSPTQLGGYVRSVRFWRRALTNTELARACR